jgi:hypothetical protein
MRSRTYSSSTTQWVRMVPLKTMPMPTPLTPGHWAMVVSMMSVA